MTVPYLYPLGHMGRSITPKDRPVGVTGMGTAPTLADNVLRKRSEERLSMCAESATVLDREWDQGVPPPMELGSGPLRGLVGVKLPILQQLGRIPRNLPCLPLPSVYVGNCNHVIQ